MIKRVLGAIGLVVSGMVLMVLLDEIRVRWEIG